MLVRVPLLFVCLFVVVNCAASLVKLRVQVWIGFKVTGRKEGSTLSPTGKTLHDKSTNHARLRGLWIRYSEFSPTP